MAQFLNKEPDPQEKASAKGVTTPAPAKMEWDNATDLGVNGLERAAIQSEAKTPAVTAGESFAAGMGNSIIAAAIRKASAPSFDTDYDFDAKKTAGADSVLKLVAPNQDELDYIHSAVSLDDYNYRIQQMMDQRTRDEQVSANLLTGIAGSVVGDAPTLLAPMGAARIAGRVGLAVRTAIRAADVGTAVYAADQPGQSAAVAALVAGMSGLDQLWDIQRLAKTAARTERAATSAAPDTVEVAAPKFDPDAPTVRAAKDLDAVSETLDAVRAKAFDNPVEVRSGQSTRAIISTGNLVEHLKSSAKLPAGTRAILDSIADAIPDIPVELSGDISQRSMYRIAQPMAGDSVADSILLRAPMGAKGKMWNTVGDALDSLDEEMSKVAVHELIHSATAKVLSSDAGAAHYTRLQELADSIRASGTLPKELAYYAGSPHEMLAGLADSPEWVNYLARTPGVNGVSKLRQIGEYIMQALGVNTRGKALDEVLDVFEDVVNARVKGVGDTGFRSITFGEMAHYAPNAAGAQKLLDDVKGKFRANFALYDNIAQGNKDLADLLVSDGAAVGARKPSVADFKRNLTLEMDGAASVVEDSIISALKAQGVGFSDRFFQRSKFKAARAALEDKLGRYLDSAYDAELNGRAVPVPDADIAPVVKAYKDSGWATRWYDHMKNSGMVEDGVLERSDYYFPRQYSYDKMRQALSNGRSLDNYRDLFRQALRDIYPTMEPELVQRVARDITDGIYNGRSGMNGPMWKQIINGMDNDELVMAMKSAGIDDDSIKNFMSTNVRESGSTSPARNLRQRNRFNMTKEYIVDGQAMRLSDLLDTDVSKVMHGYTNRMSGRVGMQYAGVSDLKKLESMINDSKHSLPNPEKWEQAVNDTIDFMLGGVAGGASAQLPEIFRAAGNLANATMLKNSALYQVTDTALAMKEFGMARVLRSMVNEPWFKEGSVTLRNPDMAARLDSILRGSVQKEMRFRWLTTYADDNLDLTRSSQWFNVTQNIGQAARHVNGMSMVHRMQVNVNAGIVADELKSMLSGSADSVKRLERWGLDPELAARMQAASAKNPGAMLPPDLQMQLEVVGSRMMDYVVQQVRTGETSHFAQFNPVGKVVVGYQSFAMAATNKILRHELNDAGWIGLAHIAAYQFPMMLLMTGAKYGMDGKLDEKKRKDWITDSVMGMSALGGITMIQPLFTGESPRHSLASMGYVMGMLGLMQDIAAGNADAQSISKQIPLIQEFAPTRAIINNFGD